MKNTKGFTLIELIGSIVILAIIAIIAFPNILSMLDKGQTQVDGSVTQLVEGAANKYVNEHKNSYPKQLQGQSVKTYTITVKTLYDTGYIEETVWTKNKAIQNDKITITANTKKYSFTYNSVAG